MLTLEAPSALSQYVGKEFAVSEWVVVNQERINQFAAATDDRQWIHIDQERATKESPYGRTIAHGFLTLSLISYLMRQTLQLQGGARLVINYGLNRVRFPSAVREGSRIRGRFTLLRLKNLSDTLEAVFACTVECEGRDKPCCVAEWVVRYYK